MASRNVTLGVPRLTEIINCSKNPKTPSLTVYLKPEIASDIDMVKHIRSQLCYTVLGDLLDHEDPSSAVLDYNTERIETYMEDFYLLQYTPEERAQFCNWMIRLKFLPELLIMKGLSIIAIANHIQNEFGGDAVCVYSDPNASDSVIHIRLITNGPLDLPEDEVIAFFKEIYKQLKDMLLCGTVGIEKAFILKDQFEDDQWVLETEGTNLEEILNHPMVDATRTISNHPLEVQKILGIEAAYQSIIDQIRGVIERYGINVQYRHLSILANVMTKDGEMMAITRHGINRREGASSFSKMTFEETGDQVFNAALGADTDQLKAVSARLIMGLPALLGTGFCEVRMNSENDEGHSDWNELLKDIKNKKSEPTTEVQFAEDPFAFL